jgi:hypothetical protein
MIHVSTLSSLAKKVVERATNGYQGVDIVHETLEHDGYDEEGPKSDLWDLYLISIRETNETSTVWQYHREDWYEGKEKEEYEHVVTTTLDKIWDSLIITHPPLFQKISNFRKNFIKKND